MFCVVTDLLNFVLGLLQAKHLANGGQWKKIMQDRQKHMFWQELCVFLILSFGTLSYCIQAVQVNCILFRKRR
jgi:hypothetical protein